MTIEEAKAVLDGRSAWVGYWTAGYHTIDLDGDFTVRELEALVVLMKAGFSVP